MVAHAVLAARASRRSRWQLRVPSILDPRWAVVAVQVALTKMGQLWLHFAISPVQVLAAVATACAADAALGWAATGRLAVPLSAVSTGLGLGLLLRAGGVGPFVLAALVAVASKRVIRVAGGHVFNPSNLGLVVALSIPTIGTAATPGQWGTAAILALAVAGAGVLVVSRVARLPLVAAFGAGLAAAVVLRAAIAGQSPLPPLAAHLNAAVLLFALFMLTDPRTSPAGARAQVLFGLVVGTAGGALEAAGVPGAIFYPLAAACWGFGIVRAFFPALASISQWASGPDGPPPAPPDGPPPGPPPAPGGAALPPEPGPPAVSRREVLTGAALGGAGIGALVAPSLVLARKERDDLKQELAVARDQLQNLGRSYVASGGGVNLKYVPDKSGKPTIPLRESFSFDRYHVMCIVEDNPEAFYMPTHSMGTVKIEPHRFFMSMVA
ncbi:MAG: RnfABCDGE type electron transport complex subunit D, partial [Chloroflexota bacterium]